MEYTALSIGCKARLALLTTLGVTARFTARPGCMARRTLRGTNNLEKKPTRNPKERRNGYVEILLLPAFPRLSAREVNSGKAISCGQDPGPGTARGASRGKLPRLAAGHTISPARFSGSISTTALAASAFAEPVRRPAR
jgi:hypothetical protein